MTMNSDLFFDGKSFISVGRASELTGYTQDYLGQLCRGGRVPSRMVGRTWYVDQDAVLAHKANPKSRKAKITQKFEKESEKKNLIEEFLNSQEKSAYVSPFKFMQDRSPILPSLKRPVAQANYAVPASRTPHFIALMLGAFALVSWIHLLSPRAAEITMTALRSEMSHLSLLSAAAVADTAHQQVSGSGLVVFPDSVKHDEAVASVESSFSDDAQVTFDQNGTSGVITPVFQSGKSSSGYAFVMVPINNKKTQ
jgi:hypothetical protein